MAANSNHAVKLKPSTRVDAKTHVPALVAYLAEKVSAHAARLSANKFGLDLTEWRIIHTLGSEGRLTVVHLANLASRDPGGVSRCLARLEYLGLIEREACESDRRKSFISLTKKGHACCDEMGAYALQREERLLRHLTPDKRDQLVNVLNILLDEIDLMVEEELADEPDR